MRGDQDGVGALVQDVRGTGKNQRQQVDWRKSSWAERRHGLESVT